jgi:Cu-Zn family superoxide dismutase
METTLQLKDLSLRHARVRFAAVTQQTEGGKVMKAGILASLVALAVLSAQAESVTKAVAVLSSTKGNSVSGTITFTKVEGGVKIVADVTGLAPGQHGFHIHEFGDCSAPDATSAGGHFNPHHMQHGAPDAPARHAGDFGNLEADASGKAHYDRVDTTISLDGADSIVGHGVIVHEKADDLKTQPTGNAGARVACGVIGVAKP